jgi:peptidoglycan/LPS O-acetylase OafA/YrhL
MLPERKTTRQARLASSRPHLYELDRLRVVTIFSVVGVHVLSKTAFLETSLFALQVQNAFVTALHFTREIFMFVTAFALVYVYYGKPLALGRFWKRRGLGVVLPYVLWSAIYIWVTQPSLALPLFWHTLWWDLLTGNASYQLYYILLTIQFYVLFPLFLVFLRRVQHHPWITLAVSFLLEVITLYVIATYGQTTSLTGNALLAVNLLQDRFVLDYQFYFVLGGLAALYLEQVRAFALRYQAWIIGGMLATFLALELHYLADIQVEHMPILKAVAVMQPIMAFYSLAAVAFFYWYAYRRVARAARTDAERGSRVWRTLSNASFGVYLVHPLFLTHILPFVAALSAWPVIVLVPLTWGLTTGASVAFCVLLLNIPLLSRLVGREQPVAPALATLKRLPTLRPGGSVGKRLPLRALAQREEG